MAGNAQSRYKWNEIVVMSKVARCVVLSDEDEEPQSVVERVLSREGIAQTVIEICKNAATMAESVREAGGGELLGDQGGPCVNPKDKDLSEETRTDPYRQEDAGSDPASSANSEDKLLSPDEKGRFRPM